MDPKILKGFNKEQKRIRNEWQQRNAKNIDMKAYDKAMKNFENMFIAMSK